MPWHFVGGPANGCRRKPNGKRPREAPIGEPIPGGNDWDFDQANSASYWAGKTVQFADSTQWEAFWLREKAQLFPKRV